VRWQRVARLVVALIGIGCAVTVYVMLRPRPSTVVPEEPPPAMLDAASTAVTKGTTVKRVDTTTGQEIFSMSADRTRVLADGREISEGVRLKFARGGVVYTVAAGEAESTGRAGPTGEEPSTIMFRKHVSMAGDDGFSVETDEATYLGDEQRMTFPGPMSYTRDRLSGQGVGADLYMDRSVLWMYDESQLTIAPDGGGQPVVITAKRIGLAQADGYLRAEVDARLTREGQRLSADGMVVHFAPGTQLAQRIELAGAADVRRTGTGPRPDMRAENIDLDFTPETSRLAHARLQGKAVLTLREGTGTTRVNGTAIELFMGSDGQTLRKLEATAPVEVQLPRDGETPARTIQSAGLVAEGPEPKGLDRAVFSGGVDYREATPAARGQAARTRVATSDSLVLGLGGALNQVTVADFRQKFTVTDDTMTATSDEGRYDARAETLQLRATAGRARPRVVDQQMEVTAQQIDIDLRQDAFEARGRVESLRKPGAKQAKEASSNGLFESGKPINGNADVLKYAKATGIAQYSGTVTLLQSGGAGQESSVIQAAEVRVDDQKQDLSANGRVRSTFFLEQAPNEPGKQGPARTMLTSDRMAYTEATRTALYAGAAAMESGDQRLTAGQIVIELLAGRRALKRLEAVASAPGEVRITLPEKRQASGLRLTYDADTDRYVVTGTPALFVSRAPAKGPDVCEVGSGTELSFLRTEGWSNVKNDGGAVGTARDRKCAEVLK